MVHFPFTELTTSTHSTRFPTTEQPTIHNPPAQPRGGATNSLTYHTGPPIHRPIDPRLSAMNSPPGERSKPILVIIAKKRALTTPGPHAESAQSQTPGDGRTASTSSCRSRVPHSGQRFDSSLWGRCGSPETS